MTDGIFATIFAILLLVCIVIINILVDYGEETISMKKEAIERGFAEYNSTNGQWQWKDN